MEKGQLNGWYLAARPTHRPGSPHTTQDYKRDPAMSEAMIRWAAINTTTRHPTATAHFPDNKLIFSNTLSR